MGTTITTLSQLMKSIVSALAIAMALIACTSTAPQGTQSNRSGLPATVGNSTIEAKLRPFFTAADANNPTEALETATDIWSASPETDRPAISQAIRTWLMSLDTNSFDRLQTGISPRSRLNWGWIEYEQARRNRFSNPGQDGMAIWRSEWPNHPAGLQYSSSPLKAESGGEYLVLLPLSGNLQRLGQAVQTGLRDAASETQPTGRLHFHDSSQGLTAQDMESVIGQINPEQIIGPLSRTTTDSLYRLRIDRPPVLALQNTASTTPGNAWNALAVSATAEARSLARHLARRGYQRPLIIAPKGAKGDQILASFSNTWNGLQRYQPRVAVSRYDPQQRGTAIQALSSGLQFNESRQRAATIERALGQKVQSHSHIRSDIDVILFATDNSTARVLVPGLRYFDASHIPHYGFSTTWDGSKNIQHNQDLDGLKIPVMPWLLELDNKALSELSQKGVPPSIELLRLYALGYDAWLVSTRLRPFERQMGAIKGKTGIISQHPTEGLMIAPEWIQMQKGIPRVLKYE